MTSGSVFAQRLDSIPLRANMSPLNEIPIIEGNSAAGGATVWVHALRAADGTITSATVDFNVRYSGLPEGVTITGLHIHRGTAAVNGPVVINTGITAGSNVKAETGGRGSISRPAQVTSADGLGVVRDLLANPDAFYINLHTTDFPGGVIRGQMIRATQTILMTSLNSANEVPANPSTATGTATVIQVAGRDSLGRWSSEVTFDIQYTGFLAETKFTGLHVHTGAAGANGPVTIDSGLRGPLDAAASGTGNLRFTIDANTASAATQAAVAGLAGAPQNYYVNLHTTTYPGGVIRGQLQDPDRIILTANMSPLNEVPPLTELAASGTAQVIAAGLRNDAGAVTAGMVIFNVTPAFTGATTFTGLHIHEGVAGQNGPVRIDSGITAANNVQLANGAGNIYRLAPVVSANALAAFNGMLANPANYYINLHTSVNPGGAVRAQMGSVSTDLPSIIEADGIVSGERVSTASVGGLFLIAGSNLASASGSSVGVVGGRELTSINGTSVTVGGFPATIVTVAPDQIVARVPPQVRLGPVPVTIVPVMVTTRNGSSNLVNLTVSWTAY